MEKEKDPLPYEKWIFRIGQPIRNDDRRICLCPENHCTGHKFKNDV
jgi:hypothetical protein